MKKKITLLKVFMTLCLLLLSTNLAWGTEATNVYQHVFNANPNTGSSINLSGVSWDISATNLNGYNSNYYAGVQIGTSSKSGTITLTSSADLEYNNYNTIKEVRLWLNTGGATVTSSVTIDGKLAGSSGTVTKNSNAKTDWTKTSKITFTPVANGNRGIVVVNVEKATASESAGYICALEVEFESAPVAVEAPKFSPTETEFLESTSVSLTCATEGADIYYTLDGTDPTDASTQYTAAINISETTTIKAIAYKDGEASDVASETYTKVAPLTTMDAIFTASATASNYWITFNNWVVSGVKGSNAYITDNAGKGLIVYKSSHGFVAGDILSGTVKCALTKYGGSAEITDLTSSAAGLTVTKDGTLNAIDATIGNLGGVNTGAYINLGTLTYNGTDFSDGTNTIKPYNTFITLPTLTNGKKYYVKGVYIQYNSTKEIAPLTEEDFAEVPATEYDITITPCENGSVTVDAEENKAQEGQVVTLTITPETHYALSTLSVTDASSNPVTVTEDNKFTMPASDVTVSATFAAIPTHTVQFYVNGELKDEESVYEGDEIEFPEDPDDIGSKKFVGWTKEPMDEVCDGAPYLVKSATMVGEDLNFYAVFATKQEGDGNYEKVTTTPADWCGKYLIVYETRNLAFDGSLETLDAVSNTKAVTISNNVIASSTEMDAIAFTVAYKTGSSTVYSLKSASGKYISGTKATNQASNGLVVADTDADFEISFNGLTIESKSKDKQMVLQYNDASNQNRFRFYSSGQKDVALYKKQEDTYSDYCTDVSYTRDVNTENIGTLCVPYAFEKPNYMTLYNIVGRDDSKIYFEENEDEIEAGKPYLFRSTEENITLTYTGKKADVAGTYNGLVGTFEGCDIDANAENYILSNNTLYVVDSDFKCGANRAYIHIEDVNYNPSDAKADFTLDFNEPTGITSYENENLKAMTVYNLNGMRVNDSYKGIVIMNGKKYINK